MVLGRRACIVVLLVAASLLLVAADDPAVLEPYKQLLHERIKLDIETKRYRLVGLKPGHSYEARVSYPATIPSTIELSIVDTSSITSRRKLLDLEKVIFAVDQNGLVQGQEQPHVQLRALRNSVHRDGPLGGHKELVYNIVVAEVWAGIPLDTLPVIGYGVLLLLAVLAFTPYYIRNILPRLLDYLTPPEDAPLAANAKEN